LPRKALLERLLDPMQVIVCDGAMGTMLYNKGVFINQCYDELSVRAPDLVREVHRAYVKAGAELLETNSFGANRYKLAQYGLDKQVREINLAAAKLAREVAEEEILVAGAAGPLGVRLEPLGLPRSCGGLRRHARGPRGFRGCSGLASFDAISS